MKQHELEYDELFKGIDDIDAFFNEWYDIYKDVRHSSTPAINYINKPLILEFTGDIKQKVIVDCISNISNISISYDYVNNKKLNEYLEINKLNLLKNLLSKLEQYSFKKDNSISLTLPSIQEENYNLLNIAA